MIKFFLILRLFSELVFMPSWRQCNILGSGAVECIVVMYSVVRDQSMFPFIDNFLDKDILSFLKTM